MNSDIQAAATSAAHNHADPQALTSDNFNRAFAIGVALNVVFVAIEATFGVFANSLALVADAGHNLSDVAGLLLAWGAVWLAGKRPTPKRTYGLGRATILAALGNAMLLLLAIGAIAWEAVGRFQHPQPVQGSTVVVVAFIGIAINAMTAALFMRGRKRDLNIRGAFLHMAADAGVSAGVVVAGLAIMLTGWLWLDPVVSLAIVAVIAASTWGLLKDSVAMAIDAVPAGIDHADVTAHLQAVPGVVGIHDLHIWPLSTTSTALTVHLVRGEGDIDDDLTSQIARRLKETFGIAHATIQFERSADRCRPETADAV